MQHRCVGADGVDGVFRGDAADNASFIVLRDLLVNGEVKETIEAFGLGIDSRDICEGVPSFVR